MNVFVFNVVWVVLGSVSADSRPERIIPAVEGQNVSLDCKAPDNKKIFAVSWTRPELKGGYVFFYRDGHFELDDQLPSYKNRVELKDGLMKDGDVTLVLKNVTLSDSGTYECYIVQKGTENMRSRSSSSIQSISIINLFVGSPEGPEGGRGDQTGGTEDGGAEDGLSRGQVGLIVGLIVPAVVLVVLAASATFLILKKKKKKKKKTTPSHPPGSDPGQDIMLTQSDPERQTEDW